MPYSTGFLNKGGGDLVFWEIGWWGDQISLDIPARFFQAKTNRSKTSAQIFVALDLRSIEYSPSLRLIAHY